ncbi:MAG: phage terminase large subunit [Nostocales cyanobacterium 94392]|nr:phage terminase large subunit [Nostocales cyanobacterium 94392]
MRVSFKNLDTKEVVQEWELTPSQEKFFKSPKKFVLFSGGYGCGKSLILTLKAIDLALRYKKNYILMGRKTYPELRDTLMKEFFSICPQSLIKDYQKAEGRVTFINGSEIIFRHLDTIAEGEIRSLNLGSAFVDQAEDISKAVIMGLRGRLRREGVKDVDRKIYLSCNPALSWLYSEFKQSPQPEYEVIEASTLENEKNLPKAYVEDLLKYPEAYKKQFVYGIWDEELLSDRAVFAREYIDKLRLGIMDPIETRDGLQIFKFFEPNHKYQMGIDASEAIIQPGVSAEKQESDESAITIVDLTTEEEVASWHGRVPPDVLAEKAIEFAEFFQDNNNRVMIIPEMNSIGLAVVNRLNRESGIRIYRREEFDKKSGLRLEKEGWRTTRQTKPLLVSRFQELLRLRDPIVRSRHTFEQFKSFVYTDLAEKSGMGAEAGFHDDCLISCLLAFWEKKPVTEGKVLSSSNRPDYKSDLVIKNGKIMKIPQLSIEASSSKKWTTS